MIDEDILRDLLQTAADAVPPPGHAPEQLAAQLDGPTVSPRAPMAPKRWTGNGLKILGAAAAVVVLVAGVAAIGSRHENNAQLTSAPKSGAGTGSGATVYASTTAPASGGANGQQHQLGGVGKSGAGPSDQDPLPSTDATKIVKTGSIDIEVAKGSFGRTVDRITTEVVGLGGFVSESRTSTSDDQPSGSLTVRVPVDSFEKLGSDLRRLGKVGTISSKGTDVTAEFVDLEARLTSLAESRDRLSAVLARADTVDDILAVQDRITQIQTQIEQLQGQQKLLTDQASFGTWAIALGEPAPKAHTEPVEGEPDGIGHAWTVARGRFGDGIEGIVEWSGPIALIVIFGAILLALGRLGWMAARRFLL